MPFYSRTSLKTVFGKEGAPGVPGPPGPEGAPGGSDAAFAGWVNDPASATHSALATTYALLDAVDARSFGMSASATAPANAAALQAGINACAGKTLYVPRGTFDVDATAIYAAPNVTIYLAAGAVIRRTASVSPWLSNANFSTKVNGFKIIGPGKITATSTAVTGQVLFLYGDDMVLDGFTIDTYAGGQAVLIGGDRNIMRAVSILNPDPVAGVGGIRMFGGKHFRAIGCHVDSGDDALQFTPIASATPAPCRDLSISDSAYIGCTGGSKGARFMVGILSTSPPGSGGLTASIRNVSWIGCHGYGSKRGIVLANTDSSGEIANVGFVDCSIDMTGATASSQDVRVDRATGMGKVRGIRFNGLRVINPATTALGVVGHASTSEHVENVALLDCWLGAPADGASTVTALGVDGFTIRGGVIESGASNYSVTGGTGDNASKRVRVHGARITGVPDGFAGVRLPETVGYRVRDTTILPATGGTTGQGVSLASATSGGVIEGNDLSALPGTKVAGTIAAGTVIKDNEGLVTKASGTATISSASTAIAVTHGLGRTPAVTNVQVTPSNATAAATNYYVSAANATTFTITVTAAPGASATYNWSADVTVA